MKKLFWIDARGAEKKLLSAILESGADAIAVDDGKSAEVKKRSKITTIAKEGDLQWGRDTDLIHIHQKKDEDKVTKWGGKIPVIVENGDWTIIPLENLLSKTTNLIQTVTNAKEATLALTTMERGADGIFLKTTDANEIKKVATIMEDIGNPSFVLEAVRITEIKPVTMSDRCCLDTTSLLPAGIGMLIGNSNAASFLVHNENVESPFCAPRPFRVNAGAVHAYVHLPNNKTKYLCELSTGDEVLAVDPNGKSFPVAIGRNKIERRPMLLLFAENTKGEKVSLVLQNAETIRLTTPEGKPASVTHLTIGDEVLAHFSALGGRHFGETIEETIREK